MTSREKQTQETLALIEFGGHMTQLEQVCFLFQSRFKIWVAARSQTFKLGGDGFCLNVPSENGMFDARKSRTIASLGFYFECLRIGKKADWIMVCTGPEQRVWLDLLVFSVFTALFRKKMILNVRGVSQWVPSPSTYGGTMLQTMVRNRIIRLIKRISFESESQMIYARSGIRLQSSALLTTIPTGFSDYMSTVGFGQRTMLASDRRLQGTLRLGILGTISEERRDYEGLAEGLEYFQISSSSKIEIDFLGSCRGANAIAIAQRFRKFCINWPPDEYLSLSDLLDRGSRCDLLVSPLRQDRGYGFGHGSGSIGDALMLRKPLLMPSLQSAFGEYKDPVFFYESSKDLASQLRRLSRLPYSDIPGFLRFAARTLLAEITESLQMSRKGR